jgi:hypothetical protein
MIAWCLIKRNVDSRWDAFVSGLRAAGYRVMENREPSGKIAPGDVLVLWNRKSANEIIADRFERAGGTVIVAENGYIGADATGRQYYALAVHGHNGSGRWPQGDGERFDRLGLDLKPWRTGGEHILICPNRFIAPRWFMMPRDWVETITRMLARITKRPVRVRPHPGHWKRLPQHPDVSLARDLENAWAMVIWSTSAGVRALAAGIPVICCAPWWICKGAAGDDLAQIEAPAMPDRLPAFRRLAHAQWTIDEIASGLPFIALRNGYVEANS